MLQRETMLGPTELMKSDEKVFHPTRGEYGDVPPKWLLFHQKSLDKGSILV